MEQNIPSFFRGTKSSGSMMVSSSSSSTDGMIVVAGSSLGIILLICCCCLFLNIVVVGGGCEGKFLMDVKVEGNRRTLTDILIPACFSLVYFLAIHCLFQFCEPKCKPIVDKVP